LSGQIVAERQLLTAVAAGRLPHAWLISGPAGIGKATLAFRFARFLFEHGLKGAASLADRESLAIDSSDPVFHRVASGGHADLLTVERLFDEERGRYRKEIAVDDVRRIAPFLRLTAAEGGWRVVIVDGADGMNRNGQNAILKILEEPPRSALLMLLTERPSALLPTIRSRCRHLALPSLSDRVTDDLLALYRPDIPVGDRPALAVLASGSIGRALSIARYDGVALLSRFFQIVGGDFVDWSAGHAFSDRLGAPAADESYRCFAELLTDWFGRQARWTGRSGAASSSLDRPEVFGGERRVAERLLKPGRLEPAIEVWEKLSHLFARTEGANLDRRLAVIAAIDTVSAALR
jgi:DNA polymerase-3 subunit delta'